MKNKRKMKKNYKNKRNEVHKKRIKNFNIYIDFTMKLILK